MWSGGGHGCALPDAVAVTASELGGRVWPLHTVRRLRRSNGCVDGHPDRLSARGRRGIVSEYRDYENGVADVLAYLAGESATVRRNVRLPSRSAGRPRQIDVLVTGRIFGMADATLVVDCKRWGTCACR